MSLSWDPAKAASNLAKHGVAFEMAERFEWDIALVGATFGHADGEPRLGALGAIEGRLYFLVYSIETRSTRVISLRKANDREKRRYATA
jgi:uncharacterized DUF497 family protein